jgi:RING finger protein 113A
MIKKRARKGDSAFFGFSVDKPDDSETHLVQNRKSLVRGVVLSAESDKHVTDFERCSSTANDGKDVGPDLNLGSSANDHDSAEKTRWRKMSVMDQQVPICKDYHDTGYCTYGDSCKFMHIRDDILSSSQLERKIAMDIMKKAQLLTKDSVSEQPEVCGICHNFFVNPVVAICGHKFCGDCAMKRFRSVSSCAVCGLDTGGVFNSVRS